MLSRRSLLFVSYVALLAMPTVAQATPAAPIQAFSAALIEAMKAGKSAPFDRRFDLVAPALDRAFDLDAILRAAVGSRWSDFSAADQATLRAEFRRFSIASWVANFDNYDGQRVAISNSPRDLGEGDVIVETELADPNGGKVELNYVMRQSGGNWRAVDILLQGAISRVAVLRSDFRATINAGGATALIARLKDKTQALTAGKES